MGDKPPSRSSGYFPRTGGLSGQTRLTHARRNAARLLRTFARSGLSARFHADGRSVLEFAESCDIATRWSCRTGVCHTWVTPLVSGEVRYSPDPLEPPEGG